MISDNTPLTQLAAARRDTITDVMTAAVADEPIDAAELCRLIARGHAVVPANPAHSALKPVAVGRAVRTKVNANIGRSPNRSCIDEEKQKLKIALDAGADFVMDLSVGDDLARIRAALLAECPAPLGTVPLYEAVSRANQDVMNMDAELLLDVIREQAEQGVDFMTLHAGLLHDHIDLAARRVMGIVSRGGSLMAEWMLQFNRQNPLYERWSDVLEICRRHDVTVSLGDGLRPGCLDDASDEAQFAELGVLGELVQACRAAEVQVMVEGPGHVPFNQIQMNVEKQQALCDHAPFYVLGPVVTDIAPGYDHITSAIGATAAAFHGASLLCYVTPSEHLALPDPIEVRQGVVAYRIAAHAADVARGLPGAADLDRRMARARAAFDWNRQFELSMDPGTARERYERGRAEVDEDSHYCSMCGKGFCAIRTTQRIREKKGLHESPDC